MAQMNLSTNKNRLIDMENRLFIAKWGGGRSGMVWEFGVSRCKLLPFFFSLFRAEPAAYGSSQARDQIRSTAAGLHQTHAGSETHL